MNKTDRERACLLMLSLYGYGRAVSERTPQMIENDIATIENFFMEQRQIGAKAQRESVTDRHD